MNPIYFPMSQTGEVDLHLLGKQVDWDNPSAVEVAIFSLAEPDYKRLLQEAIASPSLATIRWSGGKSLLHISMTDNQNELAKFLIENGADLNLEYAGYGTPLHEAAESGNCDGVKLLLKHNARIDTQDSRGETPLHKAIRHGDLTIIQQLLQHGSAIDTKDHDGVSPLDLAKKMHLYQAVTILEEHDTK